MNQPHDQGYSAMHISRLLSFLVLLLPLQAFVEVYGVSTTAELREALASAAEVGGDNTIRLAVGAYSKQDDAEGTFVYFSEYTSDLRLEGYDPPEMMISGAAKDIILSHRTAEPASSYLANITLHDSRSEYDACDADDDNDGTNDEDDAFPFDAPESLDTDSDGFGNNEDDDIRWRIALISDSSTSLRS